MRLSYIRCSSWNYHQHSKQNITLKNIRTCQVVVRLDLEPETAERFGNRLKVFLGPVSSRQISDRGKFLKNNINAPCWKVIEAKFEQLWKGANILAPVKWYSHSSATLLVTPPLLKGSWKSKCFFLFLRWVIFIFVKSTFNKNSCFLLFKIISISRIRTREPHGWKWRPTSCRGSSRTRGSPWTWRSRSCDDSRTCRGEKTVKNIKWNIKYFVEHTFHWIDNSSKNKS